MKTLIWDAEGNFLALWREGENKLVAQVQKLDQSRWLSIVFYDAPGHGAASVKPSRDRAIEWAEEAVACAWPQEVADLAMARRELRTHVCNMS